MTTPNETEEKPVNELRLPPKVEDMIKSGFMVDCKFIVGPDPDTAESIFGHKWVFAVQSEVFERMFCGDFMEAKNSTEILLPDDDPKAFRTLRRLVYNVREARLDVDELGLSDTISLYRICDKYMIDAISKLCSEHLKSFLENIIDDELRTLFATSIELSNNGLLAGVKEKLLERKYPLSDDLNKLNKAHFIEYIQLHVQANADTADHLSLFNTIEKYLTHHKLIPTDLLEPLQKPACAKHLYGQEAVTWISEERKPELLERLLASVDFAKITIENFLAGPGISKILNWQQKYFILSQLCAGEPKPTTIKLFENIAEINKKD